jgi:hypothetical protein
MNERWIIAKEYRLRVIGEYSIDTFVAQVYTIKTDIPPRALTDKEVIELRVIDCNLFDEKLPLQYDIVWVRKESDSRGSYPAVAFRRRDRWA